MTAPYGGPPVPTSARPWVAMPQVGYDAAIAAANGGQPPAGNYPPAPMQDGVSPIPAVSTPMPWERRTAPQPPLQNAPNPQPQPPGMPQFPAGTDLNSRVYGANIPQELQGRTVGEIIGIANGLRQVHLSALQGPTQNLGVQPPPVPTGQPAPPTGTPPAFDWRNPQASIGQIMDERLDGFMKRITPMLQPVVQQGLIAQAGQARNVAASQIPQFAAVEPLVYQRLQGIDPQALLNPETWKIAAYTVIGEQASRGGAPAPGQPGVFPAQNVAPGANPAPNLGTFFTETPGAWAPPTNGSRLSPQEMRAADAMGISHQDYSAWKVGQQRPTAAPFGGGY